MALRCPRRDREFDVTLFQLGPRIHAFSRCRECGSVYSEGSLTGRMRQPIDRAFES